MATDTQQKESTINYMFLCDNTQTEKVWEKSETTRAEPPGKMWNGYRESLLICIFVVFAAYYAWLMILNYIITRRDYIGNGKQQWIILQQITVRTNVTSFLFVLLRQLSFPQR